MNAPVLFTIGYEKQGPDEFVGKLRQNGIELLIDIREAPVSRKPGFSKNALRERLEKEGIGYLHLRELGTPRALREQWKKPGPDGDPEFFRREYENHLSTKLDILRGLSENEIPEKRCCLMCYEKDPSLCHRSVVAQKLKELLGGKLLVEHL